MRYSTHGAAALLRPVALFQLSVRVGGVRVDVARRLEDEVNAPFTDARERVKNALLAMRLGDPEPYIDMWAATDDVTLFGAWGPIEKGRQRLFETFRWVGSRFKGGTLEVEDSVVCVSGDLAYTVGFERGQAAVDDASTQRSMPIRVTHIYRQIDGQWRLVHRHADFPPADQRLETR